MKVLIVGHSYLAKENQKQLSELGELVEIEVASPRRFKGMIFNYDLAAKQIENENWVIKLYGKCVPFRLPESAYFFISFSLGMRRFKPDIIHIEADPFTPVFINVYLLSRLWARNAKIVCTVKQNTYTSRGRVIDALKDLIARRLSPKVNRFIAVNEGVTRIYRERFEVPSNKMIRCTHLGVDTDHFVPAEAGERLNTVTDLLLERGSLLIGYCGRLIEYKGIFDLISAVEMARARSGEDYRLALLGDGPLREELIDRSKTLSWLRVLEPIPHDKVARFLKALDLFVMPPRILPWHVEHDAHALLEAMAVGLPCVATRCGAIEDVFHSAEDLVEPEDPNALCEAILALAGDQDLSRSMGELARERVVENYSIEAVANSLNGIYREVLGGDKGFER